MAAADLFNSIVVAYTARLQRDLNILGFQADGIFGNLGQESAGFASLQEIAPTVAGSAGGYGWAQWTGPRRKAYLAFCTAHGIKPEAHESNYRYLVEDLTKNYPAVLDALRKTTTRDAAVQLVMDRYEVPGVPAYDSRITWAKRAEAARVQAESQTEPKGPVMVDTPVVTTVPRPAPGNADLHAALERLQDQAITALAAFLRAKGGIAATVGDLALPLVRAIDLPTRAEAMLHDVDLPTLILAGIERFLPKIS